MKRILAFAGGKQAGKNTCCNFLHGHQMMCYKIIDDFSLTEEGQLYIESSALDQEGNESEIKGVIDITREDMEFAEWAAFNVWPFIKHYSFAASLKGIAVGLFGLSEEQVHGTDKQKNTLTKLKWSKMPGYTGKKKGRMTAREFLQYFGSNICRQIYPEVWTERALREIEAEEPQVALISDCRFPNEVEAIQEAGGKVIHLTRKPYEDKHISENALKGFKNYDAVIDNESLGISETNLKVLQLIEKWGWLGEAMLPEQKPEPEKSGRLLVGGITKIKE